MTTFTCSFCSKGFTRKFYSSGNPLGLVREFTDIKFACNKMY